jgi:DNA-binding response OmpR family regulator
MASRVVLTPSVLLVNDARDERTMYARALRAYGYHAVTATTSVTAYHIAMKAPTDVLVTDVDIVGSMSGLQLARRLRMSTQMSPRPLSSSRVGRGLRTVILRWKPEPTHFW